MCRETRTHRQRNGWPVEKWLWKTLGRRSSQTCQELIPKRLSRINSPTTAFTFSLDTAVEFSVVGLHWFGFWDFAVTRKRRRRVEGPGPERCCLAQDGFDVLQIGTLHAPEQGYLSHFANRRSHANGLAPKFGGTAGGSRSMCKSTVPASRGARTTPDVARSP